MEISNEHFPNNERSLEYAWERAVQLAMNFDRQRVQEIAHEACEKLISIQKFETSAEIYESIGMTEQAVKTYLKGDLYERAK